MDHRVADFHAGRVAVEQQASCLLFQERYQVGEGRQVFRFGDQGRGELPVQPMQRALQFGVVGDLDDHAGRAEDFFLQQLVALQQQADVRLEQLRPGLAALLRLPGEMADARVGVQRRLRSKVRLLAAILAGAALFTLLLGLNHDQPRWLLASVFAAGFCIIGGQLTLNAFASNFYPAQVRATGTGWALGVGRFGSILGPLFGSLLLGMHISVENIFMLAAFPAGLAALLILQVRSPAAQAQRESAAALAVEES